MENCTFKNNSHYGIRIYGSRANVKNCEMDSNGFYGVHCQYDPEVKFTGNSIHHNTMIGVYSLSGNLLKFYGNVIEYNGGNNSLYHGISTADLDVIKLGIPYTWIGKNTIRYNGGTEVNADWGNPDVDACGSSIHDNSGLELSNYSGNQALYALSCYFDANGCQFSGNVSNNYPENSLPTAWIDGHLYSDYAIPKVMAPEGGLVPDDKSQMEQFKELITTRPESAEAESALFGLYSLLRADYMENKLGQKDVFCDFLDGIYGAHKDRKIGKMALRQMIMWRMLDQDYEKFIQLSNTALKELDGVDRMCVLVDLGFQYAHAGNLQQADRYLTELKQKYSNEKEVIRLLGEDIADVAWQMKNDLLKPSEKFKPFAENGSVLANEPGDAFVTYPNPANPSITLRFQLSEPRNVKLRVFDLLGREVKTLVDARKEAGTYSTVWDGKNDGNMVMPTGVYLLILDLEDKVITKKFTLIK